MPDVTVKLTLGAFSIEVSGPIEYVDKKLDEVLARYAPSGRVSALESSTGTSVPKTEVGGEKVSAAEFMKGASAQNQTDRAMLLGYYLEKVEGWTNFTTTELAHWGREVRRPFGNVSDVVAKLTARGLMMSAGDKDGQRAYALTATGEEYVASITERSN